MIQNKLYSLALDMYKTQLSIFDPDHGLAPLDVMSFFYYYGYVCTALKKYNEAVQAFRKVLIHPTNTLHKCTVNAYKKYIVVSLLSGKHPDFPKKCSETMKMFLPKLAEDYKNLEEAMAMVRFTNNSLEGFPVLGFEYWKG